jgi:hypothetical protein
MVNTPGLESLLICHVCVKIPELFVVPLNLVVVVFLESVTVARTFAPAIVTLETAASVRASYNILVEGASDAASFYAISDTLGSLFERFNILVINANGHGNIDPYVEFMTNYQIPYIAMVDTQYNGENQPSDNFVVLDNKLEHELSAAGWTGNTDSSVDPDVAYNFVSETIGQAKIQKIRNTKLGQIFDKTFRGIGADPDRIWNKVNTN